MFNTSILDVALGLTFVFILVSTLCSAIREGIESWLKTRATYLEYAIRELLNDRQGGELAQRFFQHPMIQGLYQGDYKSSGASEKPKLWQRSRNLPSYIPSRSFALALLDLAARGPADAADSGGPAQPTVTVALLRQCVSSLGNPPVERALLAAIDAAQGDMLRVQHNLEQWYDGAMERVSGWYKRSTQWVILGIALVVVGALNVNAITIADRLYRDGTVRQSVVAAMEHSPTALSYQQASDSLAGLSLPIGWSAGWGAPQPSGAKLQLWNDIVAPILGLLITALAATLGAPFWFDVLNKVTMLRSTLKPRGPNAEAGTDIRQALAALMQRDALPRPEVRDTQPGMAPTPILPLASAAPPEQIPSHTLPSFRPQARDGIVTK